jgi:GntR family transcriptional repressor for pyruvate dehydrogenase complex
MLNIADQGPEGDPEAGATGAAGVKTRVPAFEDNLPDQVARFVIEYIRQSGRGPGEKVPSEIRTAAHLQISRGVVREAYRSLRALGILEISNGRVPRVGQLKHNAQILEHGLSTHQATVEQIFDLRYVIEIRAAELAAMNRSPSHVERLDREIAIFEDLKEQQDLRIQSDLRFHMIIGEASANPLFGILSAALRETLEVSVRTGLCRRKSQGAIDEMVGTYKLVARAIISRDPTEARKQIIIHFEEERAVFLHQSESVEPSRRMLRVG